MEYCNGGDLKEYLNKKGGKLAESEVVMIFKELKDAFVAMNK